MTTTTRRTTLAQARKSALASDLTPLYAVAGLTEVVATTVHSTLAQTGDRAGKRLVELQHKPAELGSAARTLRRQLKALPDAGAARLVEAQSQVRNLLAGVTTTYGDLAGRGKRVVDETVGEVTEAVDPAFERVQEGVTVARRRVTGHTATQTVTPRSSVKAATNSRPKVAASKAPGRKATGQPAKKAPAQRSTGQQAAGQKPTGQKATARTPTAARS
jgi:hypothetical protein